jgi:hypothetical protein
MLRIVARVPENEHTENFTLIERVFCQNGFFKHICSILCINVF